MLFFYLLSSWFFCCFRIQLLGVFGFRFLWFSIVFFTIVVLFVFIVFSKLFFVLHPLGVAGPKPLGTATLDPIKPKNGCALISLRGGSKRGWPCAPPR